MNTRLARIVALALLPPFWPGCAPSEDAAGGSDQALSSGDRCVVQNRLTGQSMSDADLAKNDDPVAKILLTTPNCPTSFTEITRKLRKLDGDAAKCIDAGDGKVAAGVATRAISERAALLQKPASYRTVTTRDCNQRDQFGLFMSTFGLSADAPLHEDFVELIGADKTKGVFDFYSEEGGQWTFFGSSLDLLGQGYTCSGGACVPKAASVARCAACHVGGGLNMKELHSPWVFWNVGQQGIPPLPGAAAMTAKFPDVLGTALNGIDLESRVEAGNLAYVKARVSFLKGKGVAELLRPLFCTIDMNLQTAVKAASFAGGIPPLRGLPGDLFVDPSFPAATKGGVGINTADYDALLTAFAQTTATGGRDTPFPFIYPERSHQDLAYQAELIAEKVVDDDFVHDVLHVDFTRPIYSEARCGLLQFAPQLGPEQMTPSAIKDGFIANLAGQAGAAGTLLANLQASADQATHAADVDAFIAACNARPKKDMLSDAMKWASHLRTAVRRVRDPINGGIIEFPETLPTDNLPDSDAAFDPKTCLLQ